MEDGRIPDNRITASSIWDHYHGPRYARLNHQRAMPVRGGWSAQRNDLKQWIQADLGGLKRVSGVVTQGRNGGGHRQWVTKFTVQYSENGETWRNVEDVNGHRVRIQTIYYKHDRNIYILVQYQYIS